MDPNVVIDRLMSHALCADDDGRLALVAATVCATPIPSGAVEERRRLHGMWRAKAELLKLESQPAQRSPEWHAMRNEMITASDVAQAIGEGKFGTQREFFQKKVDPGSFVFDANMPPLVWGVKYEPVANTLYSRRNNVRVDEFGLLRHRTVGHLGASPDGITENGVMVEIKCPWRRAIDGSVPRQYYIQMQLQLDCCELDECDYFEVKFSEYDCEQDFLDDSDSPGAQQLIAGNGLEKGVLVEFMVGAARHYLYDHESRTTHEALRWKERALHGGMLPPDATSVCVTYWRVEQVNALRVYRDPEFLGETLPIIADVWGKVVAYRLDRALFDDEVLAAKKARTSRATKPAAAPVVCLLD